ncbi:MAG: hypothetical protein KF805_05515 [Phycisphaeraceae bacterium]|nr:hypothetical protein [Phycisphaeraceae bacterium]
MRHPFCILSILLAASASIAAPPPSCAPNFSKQHNDAIDRIPSDRRAFPILLQFAKLIKPPADDEAWPRLGAARPCDPNWPEALELLRNNQDAIAKLSPLRSCDAVGQYLSADDSAARPADDPGFMPLHTKAPHLAPARCAARLLWIQSWKHFIDGHEQAAADSLLLALRLSAALRDGSTTASMMNGIVLFGETATRISQMSSAHPAFFSDDSTGRLQSALAAGVALPVSIEAAESAMFDDILARLYCVDGQLSQTASERNRVVLVALLTGSDPPPEPAFGADAIKRHALLSTTEQLATRTDMNAKLVELLGFGRALNATTLRDADPSTLRRFEREVSDAPGGKYLPIALYLPAFEKIWLAREVWYQHADAARIGLELGRQHRLTGRWPDSLDGLAFGPIPTPTDRFSGERLRYRRTDGRPVVYSIGPDQVDNQARPITDIKYGAAPRSNERTGDWILWPTPTCD